MNVNECRDHRESPMGYGADVYPVGALEDLLFLIATIRVDSTHSWHAVRKLITGMRRGWRKGGYWNGYLAEPLLADPAWTRCGHGWTRHRALCDLDRHIESLTRL
jgi:hypothetical protein